jgi:uncharacterized protein (DUF433 family)
VNENILIANNNISHNISLIMAQATSYSQHPFTLAWKGKQVFPGVNKTRNICGGKACCGLTRIPVWIVIAMVNEGKSVQKILSAYPSLSVADIASAQYYYHFNQAEIDEEIRRDVEEV